MKRVGGEAKGFGGASGPTLVSFAAGAPGAPIWDDVSSRVILTDAANPATFDASTIPTTIAAFAGTAPIGAAGWAMPVAFPPDPMSLGEAAEVGAWWLRLDGALTVTWKGGPQALKSTRATPIRSETTLYVSMSETRTELQAVAKAHGAKVVIAEIDARADSVPRDPTDQPISVIATPARTILIKRPRAAPMGID